MRVILTIMIVLAALATLYVLVRGVINMAQQKEMSGERSQELMRKRVLFQGITIALAVLLILVFGTSR